ncbi:Chromatin structure remodeling complex protein sfh1 [Loxospora ochrophaea]|nr:Chromatin structure remodeling complex protein sfh1 [Loxospora ochrophaea]
MAPTQPPQAFISSYAPRLRTYGNSLLTPVIQPTTAQTAPTSRTTKRGTIAINYSEDLLDDDDFDEGEGPRRPTGLRSRREDPNQGKEGPTDKLGKELTAPVDVQGIWRDWMGKPKFGKSVEIYMCPKKKNHELFINKYRTDQQLHAQAALPLTLIPIRIDIDIPSFTPHPALPLPEHANQFGVNPTLPAYKTPDPTPPYRLKDVFLWNLHEALYTPDQFAIITVHDLDLPNPAALAIQISNQIRQQLEEYAGVALHPLFHANTTTTTNGTQVKTIQSSNSRDQSTTATPNLAPSTPRTTAPNGHTPPPKDLPGSITATASHHPDIDPVPDEHNPDDTYRCIITLNINLLSNLYTDKFEWSLLHGPGLAESFAKVTCADIGLSGEWVPAMTHAIYEAVLRLKKEACESGGLLYGGEIDNLAADGQEGGWRFDNEGLADEWEPKVEKLSKEEIEKREGDRERQIRRLRRETARFSSTTNMVGGGPTGFAGSAATQQQQSQLGYFDQPDSAETPMGRGERSKKKRRFRSLSPLARGAANTPGGEGGGVAGYGGGPGLTDWERQTWRCSHCFVHGLAVWAVRDGPAGPKTLCNNCGLLYEKDKRLPPWSLNLHRLDVPIR